MKLSGFRVSVALAGSSHKRVRDVLAIDSKHAGQLVSSYAGDRVSIVPLGDIDALSLKASKGGAPKLRDLRDFYFELRSSLRFHSNLLDALKGVRTTVSNFKLANAVLHACSQSAAAKGMIHVIDTFKGVLPVDHIERLKPATATGTIEEVVKQLCEECQAAMSRSSDIKQALFQPVLTIVAAIGSGIFIAKTQVPQMASLFASSKAPLPGPTQLLLKCVQLMEAFPPLFIAVPLIPVFCMWAAPRAYGKYQKLQDFVDTFPGLGNFLHLWRWSKLFRTLAMLLRGGMSITAALDLTARSTEHFRARRFLSACEGHIDTTGYDLFVACRSNAHLLGNTNTIWIEKVALGVESGNIAEVLEKVASDYDERLSDLMKHVPGVAALVGLLISAVIVGFVSVAAVLPGFRILSALK